MGIGVKEPITEDLLQIGAKSRRATCTRSTPAAVMARVVGDFDGEDVLERQDVFRRVTPDDARHTDAGIVGQVAGERFGVPAFQAR